MNISHTETGANQYGFYAVPKAMEPKKKYRENFDDQYEDDEQQEDQNVFATIDQEPVNEKDLERDYYVDEAPYPEFKPRERGLDYGVQIERGDLFDFDMEVRPLVQILVGRTVVSAINELQQEKQKNQHKASLDKYQKKRNAELMVTQRLEAKSKRKNEEAERRRLQKDIHIKNQKQTGKKIIARKNAKACLLGLKEDLYSQLEDAGYLRSEPISDMKIHYEDWLYQKIMQAISFNEQAQKAAQRMLDEKQKQLENQHKKHIQNQQKRRQDILDQRERVRKQNEARKEKKRIKKMRQQLNSQREPYFVKFEELMQKFEQVQSILKHPQRSNGFTRDTSTKSTVYIAGGLQNFILAFLQNSGKNFTAEEIEQIVQKILKESGKQIQIYLSPSHYELVQAALKEMEENKSTFLKHKDEKIKELTSKISLDLSLLQSLHIGIKSSLHHGIIQAILNIYLTTLPDSAEEDKYELTEADKKKLEIKNKVEISSQEESAVQKLQKIENILRVHFQKIDSVRGSQAESQLHNEQKTQEEWVDIYDGQSWNRRLAQKKEECNPSEQMAASYALSSFQSSFVSDQRTLHYLQHQLQQLLGIEASQRMKKYSQDLLNIKTRIKKEVPVFDAQLKWGA